MIEIVSKLLPILALLSHILLFGLVLAIVFRNTWGRPVVDFIREKGVLLGLIVSLITVLGSMFYSLGLGFPPCELCWWQRVLLFPTLILFLVAWRKGDKGVFSYVLPLVLISIVVSLYQISAQMGGISLLECTASEGECLKVYVRAFSYITIPIMSLTSAVYLSLISLISRKNG